MKKFFFFLSMMASVPCMAGTGNARDIGLVELGLVIILILVLCTGYYVDFLKNKIHDTGPTGYHTLHFPF